MVGHSFCNRRLFCNAEDPISHHVSSIANKLLRCPPRKQTESPFLDCRTEHKKQVVTAKSSQQCLVSADKRRSFKDVKAALSQAPKQWGHRGILYG